MARVKLEECEAALKKLASPDKWSRNQEHDGRRIEAVPGGWLIINGEYYRRLMSREDRKEYQRLYHREYRKRKKGTPLPGEAAYVAALRRGDGEGAERITDDNLPRTAR
jgi:hypothetical protein